MSDSLNSCHNHPFDDRHRSPVVNNGYTEDGRLKTVEWPVQWSPAQCVHGGHPRKKSTTTSGPLFWTYKPTEPARSRKECPMDSTTLQAQIRSAADAAAIDWFRRQCADATVAMRLYYKPGEIGFWIGAEPINEDWVEDIRITSDMTRTKAAQRIVERAQSLPILSEADSA